ncbi:MAG TPA: murein biosynthesis integral membrane protein MurJ [Bryobacteraceae bacterium]|nr:murein biosynthesis integral membrane protein MurJ [Bryobacteraceae bacterium]
MAAEVEQTAGQSAAQESVMRSAGIVSVAVFFSRMTGVLREIVMAHFFGAGFVYDAFLLGFRIPNLTRDLFAEGALSAAFVPTFTATLSTEGKKQAAELSNLVGTAVIIVVGVICALGMIFSPVLVELLAPGYHDVPGKFELAVHMTRIMFPFLLLVALAAQAMGVLNACNRFAVPALSSTFFNIGSIGFGLLLGFVFGPKLGIERITGMALGVVLGGALQLLWQIPSLHRLGFVFRPRINWKHPGLVHIIHLMGPAILGNAAVQINVMVNTNFASRIPGNGPVSWLGYAFRFMMLPLGLFGVAIASATLPAISRSAAAKNMPEFRRTLSRSLGMVFLLTIPSSIGLIVLGKTMIGAIYQGGKFLASDTQETAMALSCFAIGLAGYAALKVINPAFYALKDARTPMTVSIISIGVNLAAVECLMRFTALGYAGLALSTSAVALFGSITLFIILRKRIGGIYGRDLLGSVIKIGIASLVMGAAVMLSSHVIIGHLGPHRLPRLLDLAVSIPVGLVIFIAACRLLRVSELDLAARSMLGPLRRRFARV